MQTVSSIGSSGPLNILNGNGLLDGLGVNGITDPVANLVNGVVADAGQTVGALGNGGSLDNVLNTTSQGAGSLLDDVLNTAGSATGSGIVGGVVDGLGNDVVDGTVGGAGLLNGTPLAGLQGDGAAYQHQPAARRRSRPRAWFRSAPAQINRKGLST
jgi:hypothetical protein